MRFVVTGGAGFIGSHLVRGLLEEGHDVVVIDDFSTGKRANLKAVEDDIEIVEGSILDSGVCGRGVKGASFVLHQAAIPSVPRSVRDPRTSHEVNVTGTLNILLASHEADVKRVIYAGSSSAYGDTPELPKHEEMLPRPRSPYATSKLAGEHYCRALYHSYGLETISLRYFNVFGPRQDPNSQYAAAIPKLVTAAFADEAPTIFGDGEQSRDFTYVRNVVRANILACNAPDRALGNTYNVGTGNRITVNELWRRIKELSGSKVEAQTGPVRPGDVRHSLASLDRARADLGYEPITDFADGLMETLEFFDTGEGK